MGILKVDTLIALMSDTYGDEVPNPGFARNLDKIVPLIAARFTVAGWRSRLPSTY
jgi:hypothetical protein